MADARKIAAAALLKVETDAAYSNLTLQHALDRTEVGAEDKALATALFYGVLDRKLTLDHILSGKIKTPLSKVRPYTLTVLRMGLYQILYMDKIPDRAAVNESVALIKKSKEARNAGFVNAVLRTVIREGVSLPETDDANALSVRYSCPVPIVESFLADYGKETAIGLLEASLRPAALTVRVNTLKTTPEALCEEFAKKGVSLVPGRPDGCLIAQKGFDIAADPLYKEGYFYAQDAASQQAIAHLAPTPGSRVIDLCAAPGGKSFTAAQYMQNTGELIACDLYEQKTELIRSGAERLGLENLTARTADATVFDRELGEFDFVICDVPCSGLGVLRRKPEIKYKTDPDFAELKERQKAILKNAVQYAKKGGRILYSTCTLRLEENENLVNAVLKEYNTLRKVHEKNLMPHKDNTDGFYYALLEKE